MEWKCRILLIILVYVVAHALFSYSSLHFIPNSRHGMAGKDLSDGPLVQDHPFRRKPLKSTFQKKDADDEEEPATFHTITVPDLPMPRLTIAFLNILTKKARALVPQSHERQLLFTMVNEAYIKLTLNWFCNVAVLDASIQNRTLIVAAIKVCQLLSRNWVHVTCLPLSLEADFEESLTSDQQAFVHLLTLRAQIMHNLIKNGSEKDLTLAFGLFFLRATEPSKDLLAELVRQLLEDAHDALDALCKSQWHGVVCRPLPWETVADGKWFKLSERERLSFHPLVVNNNFYAGPEEKAGRQEIEGLWFLSKTDECQKDKVKKALSKYR